MGILIFYHGDGRIAGEISNKHWRQVRRIVPLLFDWVNEQMQQPPKSPWTPPPPPKLVLKPFKLNAMIRDESSKTEEVNLIDVNEWKRFFAVCEFLGTQDDTYNFFAAVVKLLREQSRHPDELR